MLDEWGFSAGVDSAGKGATYNSWHEHDGPNDPYMQFLADEGLAETHVADFDRRIALDDPVDTWPTPLPEYAYNDNWIARTGLDLLADAPSNRPWFLQVNFAGPHSPWDVTEDMHGWYRDPDVTFPAPVEAHGDVDPETHQEVRRNYAAMVENVDRWLGRYLDELAARDERAETVVIFASDHGEMLGDHGRWKKTSPYHPSAGVPLVAAGPGIEPRGGVETPATVLDVHATVLDYAGVDPGDVDSHSMRPYLEAETDTNRAVVFSGLGPWRLAYDGRYKLVVGFDRDHDGGLMADADPWGDDQPDAAIRDRDPVLFDRRRDPHEIDDVAARHPDVVERLRTHLEATLLSADAGHDT